RGPYLVASWGHLNIHTARRPYWPCGVSLVVCESLSSRPRIRALWVILWGRLCVYVYLEVRYAGFLVVAGRSDPQPVAFGYGDGLGRVSEVVPALDAVRWDPCPEHGRFLDVTGFALRI